MSKKCKSIAFRLFVISFPIAILPRIKGGKKKKKKKGCGIRKESSVM